MNDNDIKVGNTGKVYVLDFRPFLDGSRQGEVGKALVASLKDIGFVYLLNHGLSQDKIQGMFDWVGVFDC